MGKNRVGAPYNERRGLLRIVRSRPTAGIIRILWPMGPVSTWSARNPGRHRRPSSSPSPPSPEPLLPYPNQAQGQIRTVHVAPAHLPVAVSPRAGCAFSGALGEWSQVARYAHATSPPPSSLPLFTPRLAASPVAQLAPPSAHLPARGISARAQRPPRAPRRPGPAPAALERARAA